MHAKNSGLKFDDEWSSYIISRQDAMRTQESATPKYGTLAKALF